MLVVAAAAAWGWYHFKPSAGHGLTFGLIDDLGKAKEMFSHVGCAPATGLDQPADGRCNTDAGDTSCRAERPLLCTLPATSASPVIESGPFKGWAKTELGATRPVTGAELVSAQAASERCEAELGKGWQAKQYLAGERKDFRGVRHASLDGASADSRYWVVAANSPANCWDSAR